MNTIQWLSAYYVHAGSYDKAIPYFELAAKVVVMMSCIEYQLEPATSKWKMMVASCHRRLGATQAALDTYISVHSDYPDDLDCMLLVL